jgi:hypothetical protein
MLTISFLDRWNYKNIINLHINGGAEIRTPSYDVQNNNFSIFLSAKLGLVDAKQSLF